MTRAETARSGRLESAQPSAPHAPRVRLTATRSPVASSGFRSIRIWYVA